MNGRVYDPILALFTSPDNYVQAPDLTINYNRYSYCINNPLRYTDSSGNWFITLLFTLGNAYLNASLANNSFNPAKWELSMKTIESIISGISTGYYIGMRVESWYQSNFPSSRIKAEISQLYPHRSTNGFDYLGDYSKKGEEYLKYQLGDEMYNNSKGIMYNEIITGQSCARGFCFNTETGNYEEIIVDPHTMFSKRTYHFKVVDGYFWPHDKNIYISSSVFQSPSAATECVLHELGHAYQFHFEPLKFIEDRLQDKEYECYQYTYLTLKMHSYSDFQRARNAYFPFGWKNPTFDLLQWGFPKVLKMIH